MIYSCDGLEKPFYHYEVGFSEEVADTEAPCRLLTGRNGQKRLSLRIIMYHHCPMLTDKNKLW